MKRWSLFVFVWALSATGCSTVGFKAVRFNERQRLDDRVMTFDHDELEAEMIGHVLAPREGSVGGFSAIGAGGCGCF